MSQWNEAVEAAAMLTLDERDRWLSGSMREAFTRLTANIRALTRPSGESAEWRRGMEEAAGIAHRYLGLEYFEMAGDIEDEIRARIAERDNAAAMVQEIRPGEASSIRTPEVGGDESPA